MKTNPSLNRSLTTLLCAATAALLILSQPAQAGYIVTLQQVGSNVVATGSGALDLTGLTLNSSGGGAAPELHPSLFGSIQTGPTPFAIVSVYSGVSGPTSFGTGSQTFASSGSGDLVGIFGLGPGIGRLIVPQGYVSGSPLSDSSTYNNATFISLGVTPGIYEWTWGTGANQNFTLDAVAPAVPDSGSTLGLLSLSVVALLGATRLRFPSQLAA
jgi:VPDSG-CTERM motif